MGKLARILRTVFVTAFVAATAAHAAVATEMSLGMSMGGMEGMADCEGCPTDEGQDPSCSQICVTSLAAICPPATMIASGPGMVSATTPAREVDGAIGPPDPFPPRVVILS